MIKASAVAPLRLVFLMWLFFTFDYYVRDLGFLGIYPRTISGLLGILFAPLVHGDFNHLISNSIPLLVLGGTLFFFYSKVASSVFFQSYFFTNILVWLFGRSFYHIGASGLVYALASFLVCFGFFDKNFKSVLISIIMIIFYGGLLYGIFPINSHISWESHLMGAIVGGVMAFLHGKK